MTAILDVHCRCQHRFIYDCRVMQISRFFMGMFTSWAYVGD